MGPAALLFRFTKPSSELRLNAQSIEVFGGNGQAALRIGLEGGLALPVPMGDFADVVAVVEFFTASFRAPETS